ADAACAQLVAESRGAAALILGAAAAIGLWLLVGAYDQRRPGAKRAAVRLGFAILAADAAAIVWTRAANPASDRALFVVFRSLEVLYLAALVAWTGFFLLSLAALAAGIAAVPALWGLVPIVWAEVVPPDFWTAREGRYSERLGDWLTVTFRGLRISGELIYFTMIPVVPMIVGTLLVLQVAGATGWFAWGAYVLTNFQVLGRLSAAVFAWLFAVRGRVKKAALGFRSGIDILLDVDN